MSYEASLERILAIEEAMDVTTVRYKGLHVWPYVRLQLWKRLLHPKKYAPPASIGLAQVAQALSKSFFKPGFYLPYVEHSRRHRDHLARLQQYGKVDILLFTRREDHTERITGRFYNPHIDPIIELVKPRHTYLKLEFGTEETRETMPRSEHTHFFDSLEYLRYDAQRSLISAFQSQDEAVRIEQGRQLTDLLAGVRFDLALTEEYIMLESERILHYARYFSELLTVLSPRVVMLNHYHYDIGMALLHACRSLGITTVNLQEGRQGRFHGMYSNWRSVPEGGYGMLPDYFWCWGKSSAEHLVEGLPASLGVHRPLIGGNAWLAKWLDRDGAGMRLDREVRHYEQQLSRAEKVILVTLSALHMGLPEVLREAIRMAPVSWQWLIRLHPEQRRRVSDFTAGLEASELERVDVEKATRYPLFALLRNCHRHITTGSTVAFEALPFGVSTIFIENAADASFDDYLQRGLFEKALTPVDILTRITQAPINLVETAPFAVTDRIYAVDALAQLMTTAVPAKAPVYDDDAFFIGEG